MLVNNLIHTLGYGTAPDRRPEDIQYIVLHRVGWRCAEEWNRRGYTRDLFGVQAFYNKEIGLSLPYQFLLLPGGEVQQGRRVLDVSPHARRFNRAAIGIGFAGDFRYFPPEKHQRNAGLDLVVALLRAWPHLEVVGHTDLGDDATSEPGKQCPGELFNISAFRDEASMLICEQGARALVQQGVVI